MAETLRFYNPIAISGCSGARPMITHERFEDEPLLFPEITVIHVAKNKYDSMLSTQRAVEKKGEYLHFKNKHTLSPLKIKMYWDKLTRKQTFARVARHYAEKVALHDSGVDDNVYVPNTPINQTVIPFDEWRIQKAEAKICSFLAHTHGLRSYKNKEKVHATQEHILNVFCDNVQYLHGWILVHRNSDNSATLSYTHEGDFDEIDVIAKYIGLAA